LEDFIFRKTLIRIIEDDSNYVIIYSSVILRTHVNYTDPYTPRYCHFL